MCGLGDSLDIKLWTGEIPIWVIHFNEEATMSHMTMEQYAKHINKGVRVIREENRIQFLFASPAHHLAAIMRWG